MTLENGGLFVVHCPQTVAYSDAKGRPHNAHEGPANLFILDQHELQMGEVRNVSEELPHAGH